MRGEHHANGAGDQQSRVFGPVDRGRAAWYATAMASPQDAPTRKKQKLRATRKLAEWRKKREAQKAAENANEKAK